MIDRVLVEYDENGIYYLVVYDDGEEVTYHCVSDVTSVLEQNYKLAQGG